MSIKPVAWMRTGTEKSDGPFGHYGPVKIYSDDAPLYTIPDTHCIMSLKLTEKMIAAAIPELMREGDEDKYRALGQLICVWGALVETAREEQKQ